MIAYRRLNRFSKSPFSRSLRWLLVVALTASVTSTSTAPAHAQDAEVQNSVLDLQRMVDRVIADAPSDTKDTTNVLDLQRALQKAISPDPDNPSEDPIQPSLAVVPTTNRWYVPVTTKLLRTLDTQSERDISAFVRPEEHLLPVSSGTWARYQFHLLANAPPCS